MSDDSNIAFDRQPGEADWEDADGGRFEFDLRSLWAAVYRSRFWILGIIAGCLAAGLALTMLVTPVYRATATVQIDQEAQKILGTEQTELPSSSRDTERFLQTQLDIIRSRSVAEAVAEDLGLADSDAFLERMGAQGVLDIAEADGADARSRRVVSLLQANLGVDLPIDSRIATISFDSPDPALAERVANSFAEQFIQTSLERRFDSSAYGREFLAQRLTEAQQRLIRSQQAAVDYARRNRIVDVSAQGGDGQGTARPRSLRTDTAVSLNQQYASAVARRIDAQQQWEVARRSSVMSLPSVLENSAIQDLVRRRAEARATLESQLERRREDFPEVRELRAQIEEYDSQIGRLASAELASLGVEYRRARAQEEALHDRLEGVTSETLEEQSDSVRLGVLQQTVNTNQVQYEALLSRFNELNAEAGSQTNNLSIVDEAIAPSAPVSPSLPRNLALALLAGFALSGGFVFGRERLFDKLRTPDDVKDRLGLPMLGAVPDMGDEDIVAELGQPMSPATEAYGAIKTALQFSSRTGIPRSLAFISAQAQEGKSVSCYALARSLGRLGQRVAIVDLDLRRPRQHDFFGLTRSVGAADVLAGQAGLAAAVRETGVDNVRLVSAGAHSPNPVDLLSGAGLPQLISQLRANFDYVLIDSAPVLNLADAIAIGSAAEAVVFIVKANEAQSGAIVDAIERLRQARIRLAGAVLTHFNPKKSGYRYKYGYGYGYGYGDDGQA